MHKIHFRPGFCPDPAGGIELTTLPWPLIRWWGDSDTPFPPYRRSMSMFNLNFPGFFLKFRPWQVPPGVARTPRNTLLCHCMTWMNYRLYYITLYVHVFNCSGYLSNRTILRWTPTCSTLPCCCSLKMWNKSIEPLISKHPACNNRITAILSHNQQNIPRTQLSTNNSRTYHVESKTSKRHNNKPYKQMQKLCIKVRHEAHIPVTW